MDNTHVENFIKNLISVRDLLAIHRHLTGSGTGRRRPRTEVLNKSALVLLVACWEAFLEELAIKAFDYMIKESKNHSVFPNKVLSLASEDIRTHKDGTKVWSLAGEGWKGILEKHKEEVVGRFHTPTPKKIDTLFHHLIGLPSISKYWIWPGMTAAKSKKKLEELVDLRHEIAHKSKAEKYVRKDQIIKYATFIHRLAAKSNNEVMKYVEKQTGAENPWSEIGYGGVK